MRASRTRVQVLSFARLYVIAGLFAALALLLVARLGSLYFEQNDFLNKQANARNLRTMAIPAHRGLITDRLGNPLAVSTPVQSIWVNPGEVVREDVREVAGQLRISAAALQKKVEANKDREFLYVARHVAPEVANGLLERGLPGVYANTEFKRFYPAGEVAAHVTGFTNVDEQGQEGIELAYEYRLAGTEGRRLVSKDLHGRTIRDIELVAAPQPGEAITLTIDSRLQYIAYRELARAIKVNGASGGSAVLLDARSGEILAMTSQPGFNPNDRTDMSPQAVRNRTVTDTFEPGSTIKPFTIAAALESGEFKPRTPINTAPGVLMVAKKRIRDHSNYGVIDLMGVLQKSSNVGAAKIALSLPDQALPSLLERLGFGTDKGVNFPGAVSGTLPFYRKWRDIDMATLSYGYGLSVTALQLAHAYAIFANDGQQIPLSLVMDANAQQVPQHVISPKVAREVLQMMEYVTGDGGTAKLARVPGYRIAGKTGTVHKIVNGQYADDHYLSLFVGIAPVSSPRYVTVVMIDDPRGNQYFGGQVAAPTYAAIMQDALRILDVAPDAMGKGV